MRASSLQLLMQPLLPLVCAVQLKAQRCLPAALLQIRMQQAAATTWSLHLLVCGRHKLAFPATLALTVTVMQHMGELARAMAPSMRAWAVRLQAVQCCEMSSKCCPSWRPCTPPLQQALQVLQQMPLLHPAAVESRHCLQLSADLQAYPLPTLPLAACASLKLALLIAANASLCTGAVVHLHSAVQQAPPLLHAILKLPCIVQLRLTPGQRIDERQIGLHSAVGPLRLQSHCQRPLMLM